MNKKERIERGIKNTKLKKKLGQKCIYCGCSSPLILTIDHKIPLSRGGEDTDKNKQVCCFICNQLKGSLTHLEFKKYYKHLVGMHSLFKIKLFVEQPVITFFSNGCPSDKFIEKDICNMKEGRKK